MYRCLQDVPVAQALADRLITLATQWRLSYWLTWGILLRSWALSQQGQPEATIAGLQGCWTRSNAGRPTAFHLASTLLAETYGYQGQIVDGLHTLDEGLTLAQQSGEHGRIAELYRLKEEFIRQQGDRQPIYHWFTEGFDTADLRKAKALLEAWARS
jgi:adenylate cyclase